MQIFSIKKRIILAVSLFISALRVLQALSLL